MKIPSKKSKQTGEENIVPMINVVFLLLIFFLLAGTISPRPPFELDPVATRLQPPSQAPEEGLYVSAAGDMFFRGHRVDLSSLPTAAGSGAMVPNKAFEMTVDRRLSGELLFPIMEALAKAGFLKVRLITERSVGG